MNAEDRRAFGEIVAMLARAYDRTPDAAMIASWWTLMQDWPLSDFDRVARQLAREPGRQRMPTPGEFEALRVRAGRLSADEIWTALVANLRVGAYRRGERLGADGSAVERAIATLGGYARLGQTPEAELHFAKMRFRDALADAEAADGARQALPAAAARRELPPALRAVVAKLNHPS
jgi:hypothetical protein